ncbi:hypothetical protein HI113_43215 [Corallococcus exiguus]|nr:hypothetical protein [Corallococcus exiguus]
MEQPYSIVADALSKFQSASEPIQALMIVMSALTVFGVAWVLMRGIVEIRLARRAASVDAPDARPVASWRDARFEDARLAEPLRVLPIAEGDDVGSPAPVPSPGSSS